MRARPHVASAGAPTDRDAHATAATVSQRTTDGVFYTPPFVTEYLATETLGAVFRERFARASSGGTAGETLAHWQRYRDALRTVRVLDPSCGAGAFLLAAYDALAREFDRVDATIATLDGTPSTTPTAIDDQLFGLDLDDAAVEIARAALALASTTRGRPLARLDRAIRCGNAVVDDPRIDPRAFDWDAHWPDGFDVVLGNPPYVRQERFGPAVKAHWRASFRAFHGTADVYVYFVERALRALVAGGRLAFVVSDKWLRGAYAGPLRALLGREYTIDSLVDFGHAPVFADADAFPCLVTIRRTAPAPDHAVAVTHYPRARFARTDLAAHIASNRFPIAQRSLDAGPWHLDPPAVAALIAKMHRAGVPLAEYAGTKPHYGVKTGLNEAFVIDALTRESLVRAQPSLADILVPHAGGRDIARWTFEPSNRFLVLLKSSTDHAWPWSRANTRDAERIFAATYPALHARMHPMKRALERRTDRGTHWWELRACAYYGAFAQPKIVYQVIQFHPRYALDRAGTFTNDKTFSLPTADPWLLAVLNAPLLWWHNWRTFVHMKDDALNPAADKMLALPIARPTDEQRDAVEALVPEIIALTTANQDARRDMLAWLAREAGIATPGRKLGAFETMDAGAFVDAIRAECALTTTLAHALATAHAERAPAMRDRAERVRAHECAIAARVHSAYGLSAADEGVLRETAVPRTVGQVGG